MFDSYLPTEGRGETMEQFSPQPMTARRRVPERGLGETAGHGTLQSGLLEETCDKLEAPSGSTMVFVGLRVTPSSPSRKDEHVSGERWGPLCDFPYLTTRDSGSLLS